MSKELRNIEAIPTKVGGTTYRSRTEARWAVLFTEMGVRFDYEPEYIELSSGERYLPDFYLHDFNAYLEVKPDNTEVITAECRKARVLGQELKDQRRSVWLALGPPSEEFANIIILSEWNLEDDIEVILGSYVNRYQIQEDRRDEKVYWLLCEDEVGEGFRRAYMVGGPGDSTDHDRLPMIIRTVKRAYDLASKPFG
ncbi:hypothetical protein [Ferrimonas gelatinilytica]|uniref:Restriction endonuclease n=1 Tax=Ferrimonas gelatinilytica TaxID=1255257 RepID=A0ABP9S542_9GAMM